VVGVFVVVGSQNGIQGSGRLLVVSVPNYIPIEPGSRTARCSKPKCRDEYDVGYIPGATPLNKHCRLHFCDRHFREFLELEDRLRKAGDVRFRSKIRRRELID
jgi:hypothetical protein